MISLTAEQYVALLKSVGVDTAEKFDDIRVAYIDGPVIFPVNADVLDKVLLLVPAEDANNFNALVGEISEALS